MSPWTAIAGRVAYRRNPDGVANYAALFSVLHATVRLIRHDEQHVK
jgi:hypothetical protein